MHTQIDLTYLPSFELSLLLATVFGLLVAGRCLGFFDGGSSI